MFSCFAFESTNFFSNFAAEGSSICFTPNTFIVFGWQEKIPMNQIKWITWPSIRLIWILIPQMVSLQEEYEFHWPQWAFAPCIALVVCLVLLHMGEKMFCKPKMSSSSCDNQISTTSIDSFRRQYLVVYFLVMFADWLQGTHMYALYEVTSHFFVSGCTLVWLYLY